MKAGRRLIAHHLRRHRERNLKIAQLEISRRMNLESHMFISLIERAMCPIPAERVRDIARAYELEEADFFLWYSVARWLDEEVPYSVILYILNLPSDQPEGVADPPSADTASGPTGRRRTEREADSFLQRLLRSARVNGKAARGRVAPLLRRIHSALVPFLLLIRGITASMNFLSRLLFLWGYMRSKEQSARPLAKEISFLRSA